VSQKQNAASFTLSSIFNRFAFWVVKVGSLYAVGVYAFLGLRAAFSAQLWWVAFASNFTFFAFLPLPLFLPVALWKRARRAVLLMLPLCLGGILTFGRVFLPKDIAPAAAPLRITTFNVWIDNPRLNRVIEWLHTSAPDIVLLQEVPPFWQDGIPDLRDLYPYAAGQPNIEEGNAKLLLSRYPIRNVTEFSLASDDIFRQQRAVIDVNGRDIAVYNVHLYPLKGDTPRTRAPFNLYSSLWNAIWSFDDRIRRGQVDALLARLADERLPYIVGGDFNFSDQTVLYERMAARLVDSYREAGWGMGWTWPADAAEGLSSNVPLLVRVDYVWHSAGLRAVVARVAPSLASDHMPLMVMVDMGKGKD